MGDGDEPFDTAERLRHHIPNHYLGPDVRRDERQAL